MSYVNTALKVIHFTTSTTGGAGVAVVRLVHALHNVGIHSTIVTCDDKSKAHSLHVSSVGNPSPVHKKTMSLSHSNIYPNKTYFSHISPPTSFSQIKAVISNYDVITIHWVGGLLSIENIAYLSHQSIPIVWVFHDKYPLTGGCHCFHGCDKWRTDCNECPQLRNTFEDFPARVLEAKKKYIRYSNITVVTLNAHFQQLIAQSPLFDKSTVKTIPNGVDPDVYKPCTITHYKKLQRVLRGKKIILFVASYNSEIKGFKQFCEMLGHLRAHNEYHLLIVGRIPPHHAFVLPYTYVGYVSQEEQLAELYHLSDVTIVPSLEDNSPYTCIESLACGTPVIGFHVGGLPDVIVNGYNGYIVAPIGDGRALAHAVEKILQEPNMAHNCRQSIAQNFTLGIQGAKYKKLYLEILGHKKSADTATPTRTIREELFPELVRSYRALEQHVMESIIHENDDMDKELHDIKNSNYYKFHTGNIRRKIITIIRKLCMMCKIYSLSVTVYERWKSSPWNSKHQR